MSIDDSQREQPSASLDAVAESAEAERRTAAVCDGTQEIILFDGDRAETERVDPCESGNDGFPADSTARADRPAAAVGSAESSRAAASGGPTAGIAAASPPVTMRQKIAALKDAQKLLREDSKRCARDIRNAERRSKRLKTRVAGLTDSDLSEVLSARAEKVALDALRKGQLSTKGAGSQRSSRSPIAGGLRRSASAPDVLAGPGISPGKAGNRGTSMQETEL